MKVNYKEPSAWDWVFVLIGCLVLAFALSSCYSQKTALRQRDKIERNYPVVLADYCANNYPAIIGEPTVKTQVDTVTKIVQRDCDSLADLIAAKNPGIDMQALIDSLKGYSVVTHNTHTIDSVFVPVADSSLVTTLRGRVDSLNKVVVAANIDAAKSKKGSTNWMISFWGLLVIFAAVGYFLFKSVFKVKNIL